MAIRSAAVLRKKSGFGKESPPRFPIRGDDASDRLQRSAQRCHFMSFSKSFFIVGVSRVRLYASPSLRSASACVG